MNIKFIKKSIILPLAAIIIVCLPSISHGMSPVVSRHPLSWIYKAEAKADKVHVYLPDYGIKTTDIGKKINKYSTKKKAGKEIGIKLNFHSKAYLGVKKQAGDTFSVYESRAVQNSVKKYEKEMLNKGPDSLGKYVPLKIKHAYINFLNTGKSGASGLSLSGKRVFMIISSSVPYKTLRNYILEDIKIGSPIRFVLRGLIHSDGGEHIIPTIKYIQKLIHFKGRSGYYNIYIDIDPLIVTKYDITKVPALIYVRNYNPATYTNIGEQSYIVYGDESLKYGLKIIEKRTHSQYIKEILNRFKKQQFFKE